MKACLFLAAFLAASTAFAAEPPATTPPPAAAPQCAPWPTVKANLIAKYHEIQVGGGLINDHTLFVVFASSGGATWTTIAIDANGTACLLSVGTDWFLNKPQAPPVGGRES